MAHYGASFETNWRRLKTLQVMSMHSREISSLSLLPDKDVPEEIASFVHAINRLLRRVSAVMEQQRRGCCRCCSRTQKPTHGAIDTNAKPQSAWIIEKHERADSTATGLHRTSEKAYGITFESRKKSGWNYRKHDCRCLCYFSTINLRILTSIGS